MQALKQRKKPIMADFFGHLTLGELYITMLADRIGVGAAQSAVLASDTPDPQVIGDINTILSGCPTGFCRSKNLHDRTGFYARAFVHNEAAAYIGYSESLHYGLQELIDNCREESGCMSAEEIAVRRLPKLTRESSDKGVGWVDGLAISSTLDAATKAVALRFIEFATSEDAYKLVLNHTWMEAPRYLLPARQGIEISDAPLYADFLAAHAGRRTGTAPGLSTHLSAIADLLNCRLPIDRTDGKSAAGCKLR
jgi:thiamine pyridinylase